MESDLKNVILFPTLQKNLEQDSKLALEAKKYPEALEKLNELLRYKVQKHEIFIGKLICLMELGRNNEALDLCEDLLRRKDADYYHYVHIYLTILFQMNEYKTLMAFVDDVIQDRQMPEVIREQLEQLYKMSKQMNIGLVTETAQSDIKKLKKIMKTEAYIEQWEYIEKLRKANIEPPGEIYDYLKSDQMHPVVTTALLEWLQDQQLDEMIEVHKFGVIKTLIPKETSRIKEQRFFQDMIQLISEFEQENPSLHNMLQQLLYRYTYVRFPVMVANNQNEYIAQALLLTGKSYLNMTIDVDSAGDNVRFYMEEIKYCESIYFSIIED